MKRLAVAIALVVVALCTSALGEEFWTWSWNTERPTDFTYDVNDLSNIWLTKNNGAHAVAMAWACGGFWTTVVAEVRKEDEDNGIDSVTSFDWAGDGRQTPFPVWEHDEQDHPNPSEPCVSANGHFKFWMCTEVTEVEDRVFENQCIGASAPTCTLGVRGGTSINFTTASTENNDTTFASACYPGAPPNLRLFAAFENWDDAEESFFLTSRRSSSGGTGWQSPVPIEEDQNTQPSLATGIGNGSYVYVAYKTPDGSIKFERSSDHTENWGSQFTLSSAGDRPCIAAVGQFVFACWHNEQNKIVYRFSTNAGGAWSSQVTKGDAATYAQTNVSAITEDGRPRVLLTCRRQIGNDYYTHFDFGTLVTDHISWSGGFSLSPKSQGNADLRPSLATANYEQGHYNGRIVYNAPIPSHKRGFHLRRGAWTAFEI